jgi:hypothetical protein
MLGRYVAHGKRFEKAPRDVGIFQITLAVREIVGQPATTPRGHLLADSPSFFGPRIAISKKPAEAFDTPQRKFDSNYRIRGHASTTSGCFGNRYFCSGSYYPYPALYYPPLFWPPVALS